MSPDDITPRDSDEEPVNELFDIELSSLLKPGAIFADRYEVEKQLGYGGMGAVYSAQDQKIGKRVALKILHPTMLSDAGARRRFIREGRNSLGLKHPHIVHVNDFGLSRDGLLYMEMEYLHGESLADILMKTGPLTLARFVNAFAQILSALVYAHDQGFVHRDIKPSNIMLIPTKRGAESIKLVDFGVAKFVSDMGGTQELTALGEFIGSPCYMSPEQCEGNDVDARSDLYSLACVMYEAISGVRAFRGGSALRIMHKQVKEMPPALSKVRPDLNFPMWLEDLIFKGLAKKPRDRYDTANRMKHDLLDGRFKTQNTAEHFEVLPWESLQRPVYDETASGTFDALVSGSNWEALPVGVTTMKGQQASTLAVGTISNPSVFKSFNWAVLKLLSFGGMIKEEDILMAREFQQHNGGDLGKILVLLGKLDNKTLMSAVQAQRLIELNQLKMDRAVTILHYCQRMRIGLEDAMRELGDKT